LNDYNALIFRYHAILKHDVYSAGSAKLTQISYSDLILMNL